MKNSAYCLKPRLTTNCAHSSEVQADIMVLGRSPASKDGSKVGVCSGGGGSEEVSESVCDRSGEVIMLLSNSSSASESSW